jgi:FtsH-binding integral membrane protein
MSIITTLIKAIIIVLLIPIIIFILFHYLEKNYVHAWFWATIVGTGNLLLIVFSPNRKMSEGIKMLGFFDWIAIIFVSLGPIILFHNKDIVLDIFESVTVFWGFIGYSVFGLRTRELLWRLLWKR